MAINVSRNQPKPPRIIIHGEPGIGKSTFGVCAPSAVVIQTEDGLGNMDASAFPLSRSFAEVMESIGQLYTEPHDFKTLMVDSLDWLEPLIWAEVCRTENITSIEKLPYGKGYTEALSVWRQFFDGITALRDYRGMIVIMTAHSELRRVEDPTMPAYDCHDLKLHKRASSLAEEFADVILFAAMQTTTVTEDKGFNQSRVRATTTGQRIIHTVGQPSFLAKNRYSLPSPLPLTWADFAAAMWPAAQQQTATT